MRALEDIRVDIERASNRRAELWKLLGGERDAASVEELHRLERRLADLWDEQRAARAQLRFGDRARIVARARAEERLERNEGLARAA